MSTDVDDSKRARQKARRAARLQAEQQSAITKGRQRQLIRAVVLVVAVVAVVGLGLLMVRGSDATLGVEPATVQDGAAPLPVINEQGTADVAVGTAAPIVSGFDPEGEAVTIGQPGTAQAVVFLAHWCPHCQEEVPVIGEWAAAGLIPDDVELVAVSTLQDPARPNWPPDEWLDREDFPGAVLIDGDDSAATAWGLTGTPMWAFVDANGTIVARYSGQIDQATFEEAIAAAAAT